jgi:hypothetical protein
MVTAGLQAWLLGAALAHGQETKELVEVFKSRAEVFAAEAADKQANASIINAMGNYAKARAEAARIDQDTRKARAENDFLEAKVFYDKRSLYHAYKETHKVSRPSTQEYADLARRLGPSRLASYQLWAKPGYLRWPSLLLNQDFAEVRSQIDDLFAIRQPQTSGAGSQNCVDIQERVSEMKSTLTSKLASYKPVDYIAAKKFLEGLALEAQLPAETETQRLVRD